MNVNQEKVQDLIKDLNKIFEELVRNPEDQEKVYPLKIEHDELFCDHSNERRVDQNAKPGKKGRNDKIKN